MTGLELKGVSLRAGDFGVSGIDLAVEAGTYFVLMGHTGAGKSLVMKAICGVWPLTGGRIRIEGRDVTDLEPCDRGVGYVPQDSGLFPHLSVRQNIAFALDLIGLPAREAALRTKATAEELGITALLDRRIAGLSGGERQKVALARALTRRPRLLLLDEPVSALDEKTWDDICALLRRAHREHNLTTIHICHNRAEAQRLGDRVGVMSNGKLVTQESKE